MSTISRTQAPEAKNPSPKQRFMSSGDNISKHRNLIDSPELQRALDFAMLEYQGVVLTQNRDGNSAMATGFRLQGAHEFIHVLRNLSEPTPTVARLDTSKLNHEV